MTQGSYNFETLNDLGFQTERLRQQALAVRNIEANILRSAGIKPGDAVLELGSGPGFVTDLLADLVPEGSLYALEPSPTLLSQVEGNVKNKPAGGLTLLQAYGNDMPLADNSVDFSYARFVLQHIPQPGAVLAEVCRVTRPGGRLCVVDSDDGLVVVYPEQPQVSQLLRTAESMQAEQGGDRFIGRKVHAMMSQAGFTNIRTRILALTSSELPFGVLFNILLGYKASLLGDAVDLRKLYEELAAQVAIGSLMIAGGVFIVTGEKA